MSFKANLKLAFTIAAMLAACEPVVLYANSSSDSGDNNFTINFGGRLQADYAWMQEDNLEHREGFEVRRARLYLSGDLAKNWNYKAQYDFKGDGEWKDLYIGYKGIESSYIQAGQIYEMVGLEGYTSSKNLTFIERSLPVAFVPDRALGISMTHWKKNWMFAGGFYGRNLRESDDDSHGYSARAVWSHQQNNQVFHIGASLAARNPDSNSHRIRTRPETHVTDTRLIDTSILTDVSKYTTRGIELAWVGGPFSLQHETMQQTLHRTGNPSSTVDSWYLLGSYFLTGESRNYSQKYGIFSSLTPQSSHGAWELGVRYSEMNLNDGAVQGGSMKNWTLGLNWYLDKQLKFALNYINSKARKAEVHDNPKTLQLRMQYLF